MSRKVLFTCGEVVNSIYPLQGVIKLDFLKFLAFEVQALSIKYRKKCSWIHSNNFFSYGAYVVPGDIKKTFNPREKALDLSTVQALNKLSAFEHPVESSWAVLSLVESNLKLVKLFAQHGSTVPLFRGHPCVAQRSRVHLHSNAQLVEPTHAQCPAYPKIAMVHSYHFLVACSALDHFTMLL